MAAEVTASAAKSIAAPVETVWAVLTDITSWSDWYTDLRNVAVHDDAPTAVGTRFSFKSGPVIVEGTVDHLEPPARFGFTGKSRGADAVYRFTMRAEGDATWVEATQVMTGLAVRTMGPMLQKIADSSLPAWLESLRVRAERNDG